MIITFDLETTGADPKVDLPVQVAAIETHDDWSSTPVLNTLCNPGIPIAEGAIEVHHITNEMVQATGILSAEAAVEVLRDRILGLAFQSPVLAGHNHIRFDIPMALRVLPDLQRALDMVGVLDTLLLARRYWPTAPHRLGELHEYLGFGELTGAHGALEDCIGVVAIISALCKESGKTPAHLADECKFGKPFVVWPYGKHKGKNAEDVPDSYVMWCANKFGDDIDIDQRASFRARLGARYNG